MMNWLKPKKSLSEIEEETDELEAQSRKADMELTIAQKRAAIEELRQRGLSPKHFGFDFKKIIHWLKTH